MLHKRLWGHIHTDGLEVVPFYRLLLEGFLQRLVRQTRPTMFCTSRRHSWYREPWIFLNLKIFARVVDLDELQKSPSGQQCTTITCKIKRQNTHIDAKTKFSFLLSFDCTFCIRRLISFEGTYCSPWTYRLTLSLGAEVGGHTKSVMRSMLSLPSVICTSSNCGTLTSTRSKVSAHCVECWMYSSTMAL